jgi:2-hydroxychromene-2-carboxylate isomerase
MQAGEHAVALIHRLYRALWVEDLNLDDREVLAALAAEVGVPADRVEAASSPEARLALVTATAEAQAAGVFGAPTCIVRGPDKAPLLFWGQDRLDLVAAALRGWRPAAE